MPALTCMSTVYITDSGTRTLLGPSQSVWIIEVFCFRGVNFYLKDVGLQSTAHVQHDVF